VEELLFFISRFASVRETGDTLSLEVYRLIEIKRAFENTLGSTNSVLMEADLCNGFVESALRNGPSELNVGIIVFETLLLGLDLLLGSSEQVVFVVFKVRTGEQELIFSFSNTLDALHVLSSLHFLSDFLYFPDGTFGDERCYKHWWGCVLHRFSTDYHFLFMHVDGLLNATHTEADQDQQSQNDQ
jgi:hypothetical protein